MSRWIALLRGVNVNGITVRSAELAQLFRDLGFAQVRTVLASGNVCFETEDPGAADQDESGRAALKTRIEAGLSERFGYEAWIVLVLHETLSGIIAGYPFAQDAEHHAYVVFASDEQARDEALAGAPAGSASGEQIAAGEGVVYWRCPRGSSTDTPFSKHVAKARFKATTTTRNLNTLHKLL